jgi:hypothetical protein
MPQRFVKLTSQLVLPMRVVLLAFKVRASQPVNIIDETVPFLLKLLGVGTATVEVFTGRISASLQAVQLNMQPISGVKLRFKVKLFAFLHRRGTDNSPSPDASAQQTDERDENGNIHVTS